MKRTKILATLGPATQEPETIRELILRGVNVFRFNLKHNDLSWHANLIQQVHAISQELGLPVGVLIDLQGPEIRITLKDDIELQHEDMLTLVKDAPGSLEIQLSHPEAISYLKKGQRISIDDGRFIFEVVEEGQDRCKIISFSKGVLKNRKTFNVPGVHFPFPALTKRDKEAVRMGRELKVDYIALSFVRTESDLQDLRVFMAEEGITSKIIAKIETQIALENMESIIELSDGIMIARGDLGIELPIEQVPYYQKILIKKCIEKGLPVITATQMLHSMTRNPSPTRAEISDVANAVYDFTDAVMLSEETAAGEFPLETVDYMAKTVVFSENKEFVADSRAIFDYVIDGAEEMLCDTAYNLYLQLSLNNSVGGLIVFTQTGRSARKLSRYRLHVPIYAFCPDLRTKSALTLSYAVTPHLYKETTKGEPVSMEDIQQAIEMLKSKGEYDPSKSYIVMHGDVWMVEGRLSTIKIIPPQV